VRENRTQGSARGQSGNWLVYLNGNMKKLIVGILLLSSLLVGTAAAGEDCATEQCEEARQMPALPPDVKSFVDRRDGCDHFRGEPWDGGDDPVIKERREFIFQNLKDLCTGTDKQLEELRAKYRNNPVIIKLLGRYEDRIEMK